MASAVGNHPTLEAERTALGEKGNALDCQSRTSLGSFDFDWLYYLDQSKATSTYKKCLFLTFKIYVGEYTHQDTTT
jgi:hypothetical protein